VLSKHGHSFFSLGTREPGIWPRKALILNDYYFFFVLNIVKENVTKNCLIFTWCWPPTKRFIWLSSLSKPNVMMVKFFWIWIFFLFFFHLIQICLKTYHSHNRIWLIRNGILHEGIYSLFKQFIIYFLINHNLTKYY
jgi:hypothetical protein